MSQKKDTDGVRLPGAYTLDALPDDFTPNMLMQLSKEELKKIEPAKKYWGCQAKKCERKVEVLDYGIHPWFFKWGRWINITRRYRMCAKHWKILKHLTKLYGKERTEEKLLDLSEIKLYEAIETKDQFSVVKKIEKKNVD
jgi:hypothetical protein